MARRIRCICGKIYEPAHQPQCPVCGAKPPAAPQPKVEAKVQESAPPVRESTEQSADEQLGREQVSPAPLSADRQKLIKYGGIAAAVLGLVAVLAMVLRKPPSPDIGANVFSTKVDKGPGGKSPGPDSSTDSKPGAPKLPAAVWGDLNKIIADAAEGATVALKPGTYEGSFAFTRALRLVGDVSEGGKVKIRSTAVQGLDVKSKGVILENLLLTTGEPGQFVLATTEKAEVQLINCEVDAHRQGGFVLFDGSTLKAEGTTFSNASGAAIVVSGQSKVQLTGCTFKDNETGLEIMRGPVVELVKCGFQGHGGSAGRGGIMRLSGDKTSASATDCSFSSNQGGALVSERASLVMKGCTFSANGVEDVADASTFGLVLAKTKGRASFTGCVFEQNRQGLAAVEGGTLELSDCQFRENGLETKNTALNFFGDVISANNGGSTVTLRKTKIVDSKVVAVKSFHDAVVTLEECEVRGGAQIGILVGLPENAPAEMRATRTVVSNCQIGILAIAGSQVMIDGGTIQSNVEGLVASGRRTKATLQNVTLAENKSRGLWCQENAELNAKSCVLQNNAHAVAAGLKGKPLSAAYAILTDCQVTGSTEYDLSSYAGSRISAQNLRSNKLITIFQESRGQFDANPPSAFIVTTGDESSAPGSGPVPAPGSGPAPVPGSVPAIKTDPSRAPKPRPPQRSRTVETAPAKRESNPIETVRGVLDQLERAKQIFR